MIYVMSDIHGRYQQFLEMLDKIDFREEDSLFLLGDLVDRGEESMELIKDLSYRSNIYSLLGNHDELAWRCLNLLKKEITETSVKELSEEDLEVILEWVNHLGGNVTMNGFKKLSIEDRESVLEYFEEMSFYEELEVNNKQYILVHTMGFESFEPNKDLSEYELPELLWDRCDYGMQYFDDKILVTGHTPTTYIQDNPKPGVIYKDKNHLAIDCGMDTLGCLCLDTMEEFYIKC